MPTKPLDRLMFAQGGMCFFCRNPLPKSEASVEHLLASSNGGSNADENCVACCKSINALFGSMSLKEKIQIVLNQKGDFKCPNGAAQPKARSVPKTNKPLDTEPAAKSPTKPALRRSSVVFPDEEQTNLVVKNLKSRKGAMPRTVKTLTSTVAALFNGKLTPEELGALILSLQSKRKIAIVDGKISYSL